MYKVLKTLVHRRCMNPVTGTACTSVDICVNAYLELVDKFCYFQGDNAAMETRIQIVWNNSDSLYHCLPVKIYH